MKFLVSVLIVIATLTIAVEAANCAGLKKVYANCLVEGYPSKLGCASSRKMMIDRAMKVACRTDEMKLRNKFDYSCVVEEEMPMIGRPKQI